MADEIRVPLYIPDAAARAGLQAFAKQAIEDMRKIAAEAGRTTGKLRGLTAPVKVQVPMFEQVPGGPMKGLVAPVIDTKTGEQKTRTKTIRIPFTADLGAEETKPADLHEMQAEQRRLQNRNRQVMQNSKKLEQIDRIITDTSKEVGKTIKQVQKEMAVAPIDVDVRGSKDIDRALSETRKAASDMVKKTKREEKRKEDLQQGRIDRQVGEAESDYNKSIRKEYKTLATEYGLSTKGLSSKFPEVMRARIRTIKRQVDVIKKKDEELEKLSNLNEDYNDLMSDFTQYAARKGVGITPYLQSPTGNLEKDVSNLRRASRRMKRDVQEKTAQQAQQMKAYQESLDKQFAMPRIMSDIKKYSDILGVPPPAITGSTFAEQLRAAKAIKSSLGGEARQKMEEKWKRGEYYRHKLMSTASAGIGLFGSAGMPLLNVAFAAWSGGMAPAGVAAVSTAIGESIRAFESLRNTVFDVAKGMNFLSHTVKRAESKYNTELAWMSIGVQTNRSFYLERKAELMNQNQGTVSGLERNFGAVWDSIKYTTQKSLLNLARGRWPTPETDWITYASQAAENYDKNKLKVAEESLRTMRSSVKLPDIGTDPYQEYMRIQNFQFDLAKQFEEQLRREEIDALKKNVEALRRNTEAMQQVAPGAGTPIGGVMGGTSNSFGGILGGITGGWWW